MYISYTIDIQIRSKEGKTLSTSVCIIGAGIGGLTAGAYLAKAGFKVTIVEKASTVGGSCGTYIRHNRKFPTGATIAFGLEEEGLFRRLLDDVEIDLPANKLSHPMDVILADRTIHILQDAGKWEDELEMKFPERKEEVLNFWRELTKIANNVLAITNTNISLPIKRWTDLGQFPQYAINNPISLLSLARYLPWTVEELLKKHDLHQFVPFRQFLNAQLLDAAQTDVTKAALIPSSVALSIYRKGSFSIDGGLGEISNRLANKIEQLGGRVIVSSPVRSVCFNDGHWEVTSSKWQGMSDIVINNSGVSFGEKTSYADLQEFSWGALRLDALVKKDLWHNHMQEKQLPFAYQIVSEEKMNEGVHGPIYVTFQPAFDKQGNLVEDQLVVTASVHTNPDQWLQYSKEDYKLKKHGLIEYFLSTIEKVVQIRPYFLQGDVGTPSTYQKWIGKAEVGGFPLTVKNAVIKPKGFRSKLPQMYIVGEQVFPGPGTMSAALSGFYAARDIIKNKR